MNPVLAGVVALAVTAALTPVAAAVARRLGVLDHPGQLKPQSSAVPYLGGVPVMAGLCVAVLPGGHPVLIAGGALALLLGLADDIRPAGVASRLGCEAGIGVVVALAAGERGALGIAVAAVATVALLNAVNLVDGIDGLAGLVALLTALGCALVLDGDWRVFAAGLAGACAGFLVWNRPPARIYLGDAGSYALGAALATLLVHLTVHPVAVGGPLRIGLAAAGVLALAAYPLVELTTTVLRRLAQGRSVFAGDRDHAYDRLRAAGCSVPVTVGALGFAQATAVGIGVLLLRQRG